jgi:PhoH-like ATPase
MANNSFTGVRVVDTTSERINQLYKTKQITIGKKDYPNSFIVFKNTESQSALTRVDTSGTIAHLISDKLSVGKIKPRNKEQSMALDMLLDDKVPVCIMTGKAGTGKTLLALAVALEKIEEDKYEKIILTRPMSQVGQYDLGALPGSVDEKFMPYLGNYHSNLSQLGSGKDMQRLMEQFNIQCMPIQLMRGCSFAKTFIICDETQVLDKDEMLTIGTRVGEGSKIVIMGDLNQRDEKIAIVNTGLYEMMNSKLAKESHLVAAIELLKIERSETARLFTDIFDKENK